MVPNLWPDLVHEDFLIGLDLVIKTLRFAQGFQNFAQQSISGKNLGH